MEIKELNTLEEIRIYSDPYRMQIMNEFLRLNRPATIKEVADVMREVPAKVYYHAKKLESIGLLQLVDTKLVNGITAKYFEPFKGQIHIRKSEMDEAIQQVFQSETEKLLTHLYDESKQRFLKASRLAPPSAQLTSPSVFLTKEKAEELFQWINDFCEQHQDDKKSPDAERYEIFFTIAKNTDSPKK
ncbi:helix-turn-helix domain-containing protein [Paenibacillus macerans]|uniref:winged helix-turn-helix domain-containing protein n=1 Tax=Paenibacillus macerans TaxID=44252 RepID=UPI00203CA7F3|nr:helix-turn-helix domain-containing protein [Paenibacillus macerans]MCM3699961.1 helix-turn-helix domain-containing protein [Paenibacillus macerans]